MVSTGKENQNDIPFGPLTPEDRDRLSASFYDGSQTELQRIAIERGVQPGDASRRSFQERLEKAVAEGRLTLPPTEK